MDELKKCGCGCHEEGNSCDHDHENGCDCEQEQAVIYVTFEDEGEDKEVACDVLGIFEVEEREYIALAPQDEEDILIYRYSEEGEEIQLDELESDEEYDKVYDVFDEIFAGEFEDEEDGEDK